MNKISFAILCNYVQSVVITLCLLLFPSISSYKPNILEDFPLYWTHNPYVQDAQKLEGCY